MAESVFLSFLKQSLTEDNIAQCTFMKQVFLNLYPLLPIFMFNICSNFTVTLIKNIYPCKMYKNLTIHLEMLKL